MDTIKFLKIREVKDPVRAHSTDAGIDFFVPKFTPEFIKDFKEKNSSLCTTTYTDTGVVYCTANTDMHPISPNSQFFFFDEKLGEAYFNLRSGERANIPSGIKCRMLESRALIASNKSGIASKYGLVYGAQTVDYEYTGEIHINVINTSNETVRIYENMKILQFIETPIYTSKVEIHSGIDESEFYKGFISRRGDGGFGSTTTKK
jgi:dUTPase